jgi:hypothetical protein
MPHGIRGGDQTGGEVMELKRRHFLLGMLAAPVVVRSGLCMPIKAINAEPLPGMYVVTVSEAPFSQVPMWLIQYTKEVIDAFTGRSVLMSTLYDGPVVNRISTLETGGNNGWT